MLLRNNTDDLIFVTDVSKSSKLSSLCDRVEILISSVVDLNNLELKDFYLNTTLDIIHLKKKISSTIVKKEIDENSELINKLIGNEIRFGLNNEEVKRLNYNYKLTVDLNISVNTEKDFNLLNIGTFSVEFNYNKNEYSITAVIQIVKEKNVYYKHLIFRD